MANDTLDKALLEFIGKRTKAVIDAEKEMTDQIAVVAASPAGQFSLPSVTKEAALLAACSAKAMAERQHFLATEMSVMVRALHDTATEASAALERTDASTKRLADWTKGLVFATWFLGVATIIAAVVGAFLTVKLTTLSDANKSAVPQVIVVPSPPRP